MSKVAIYCRLSKEDVDKEGDRESESIQNQKNMLMSYALAQTWEVYQIYTDDDYSGADATRPEYNRLLSDAEQKKFDVVLCKMQSRFTRDMEQVEKYINNKFKEWGIRFVSIVDNSDTDIKSNKKNRQINGLVNEWYLEDLSENVRAVLDSKKRAGAFIGAFAPFGYKKDLLNRNKLIIDEPAAEIVKKIFDLYMRGYGILRIAERLNDEGIPSPAAYKIQNGSNYKKRNVQAMCVWSDSSVNYILKTQTYAGDMVQGKSGTISFKNQKKIRKPRKEWIVVSNTHEPIIERETFEKCLKLASVRTRAQATGEKHLFAGKIKCESCGSALVKHHARGKIYFRCRLKKISRENCKGSTVSYDLLYETVFNEVKSLVNKYASEEGLSKGLEVENVKSKSRNKLIEEVKNCQSRIDEIDEAVAGMYMSAVVKKLISEKQFVKLNEQFMAEQNDLQEKKERLEKEITGLDALVDQSANKLKVINKYLKVIELSKELIEEFIDYIVVGNTEKIGVKNITIYWNL